MAMARCWQLSKNHSQALRHWYISLFFTYMKTHKKSFNYVGKYAIYCQLGDYLFQYQNRKHTIDMCFC